MTLEESHGQPNAGEPPDPYHIRGKPEIMKLRADVEKEEGAACSQEKS